MHLFQYAVIMFVLAAGMMYLAVVIFLAMDDIYNKVAEWLGDAFGNDDLRQPFHAVESAVSSSIGCFFKTHKIF